MAVNTSKTMGHWIDGQELPPSGTDVLESLNPIDDSLYGTVARGTVEDINTAVNSAHAAFASYSQSTTNDREAWLCKAAELLEKRKEEFIDILHDEGGSTRKKAEFETNKAISFIRAAVGMVRNLTGKTLPSDYPGRISMTWREARGCRGGYYPV